MTTTRTMTTMMMIAMTSHDAALGPHRLAAGALLASEADLALLHERVVVLPFQDELHEIGPGLAHLALGRGHVGAQVGHLAFQLLELGFSRRHLVVVVVVAAVGSRVQTQTQLLRLLRVDGGGGGGGGGVTWNNSLFNKLENCETNISRL